MDPTGLTFTPQRPVGRFSIPSVEEFELSTEPIHFLLSKGIFDEAQTRILTKMSNVKHDRCIEELIAWYKDKQPKLEQLKEDDDEHGTSNVFEMKERYVGELLLKLSPLFIAKKRTEIPVTAQHSTIIPVLYMTRWIDLNQAQIYNMMPSRVRSRFITLIFENMNTFNVRDGTCISRLFLAANQSNEPESEEMVFSGDYLTTQIWIPLTCIEQLYMLRIFTFRQLVNLCTRILRTNTEVEYIDLMHVSATRDGGKHILVMENVLRLFVNIVNISTRNKNTSRCHSMEERQIFEYNYPDFGDNWEDFFASALQDYFFLKDLMRDSEWIDAWLRLCAYSLVFPQNNFFISPSRVFGETDFDVEDFLKHAQFYFNDIYEDHLKNRSSPPYLLEPRPDDYLRGDVPLSLLSSSKKLFDYGSDKMKKEVIQDLVTPTTKSKSSVTNTGEKFYDGSLKSYADALRYEN